MPRKRKREQMQMQEKLQNDDQDIANDNSADNEPPHKRMKVMRASSVNDHQIKAMATPQRSSSLHTLPQATNPAASNRNGSRHQNSRFLGASFSAPPYRFQGSLVDATQKGRRENKWLLINIQDAENVCSHGLNRDIWNDKDLMPVIREKFIFYQCVTKTDNAKRIIDLYHPTKFPCIFVCDPNTARRGHEFIVPDSPDKIAELRPKILQFVNNYPNPKAKAMKVVPKATPPNQSAPEDEGSQSRIKQTVTKVAKETPSQFDVINNRHNVGLVRDKNKDEIADKYNENGPAFKCPYCPQS